MIDACCRNNWELFRLSISWTVFNLFVKRGGRIQNEDDLRYTQELLGGKFIFVPFYGVKYHPLMPPNYYPFVTNILSYNYPLCFWIWQSDCKRSSYQTKWHIYLFWSDFMSCKWDWYGNWNVEGRLNVKLKFKK